MSDFRKLERCYSLVCLFLLEITLVNIYWNVFFSLNVLFRFSLIRLGVSCPVSSVEIILNVLASFIVVLAY